MEKHLLMIINEDRFFLSHRLPIAVMARERGWKVTIVAKDTGSRRQIEDSGLDYIDLPINPTGMNPIDEYRLFRFLRRLIKESSATVVHLVGLKNILWGGLAARFVKEKGVLFAVSGLGTLFGEEKKEWISRGVQRLIKTGMNRKKGAVIFQNEEDRSLFINNGITGKCDIYFIKGSGVDLNLYTPSDKSAQGPLRIIFTGRMLKEKGVEDLVAAAELLRDKYEGKIEILLCGELSSNPRSVSREELERFCDGKYIKWLGQCGNIPQLLSNAHIMCFPSYYREGVPKSLLEASAAGLPIVTTDSVGCRDTVEEGKNGLLVPPHSPESLANALEKLINDKALRERMGKYSREKAEKEYDVDRVARKHLEIYDSLLQKNS